MLKTPFLGILGQKGQFWTIFGQKGAIFEILVKKRNVTFLLIFFSFFNTKNSNARIFGKMGTYEVQTDERTEVNPKVHRLRRETKKSVCERQMIENHLLNTRSTTDLNRVLKM